LVAWPEHRGIIGIWPAQSSLPVEKTLQFPALSKMAKSAGSFRIHRNVASARNACGKFFTGMIRSPSA
jgi:hypothetical protein